MARDWIRYDLLVQDALRGVVRSILERVARESLPGNHHFFITFRTKAPGVEISDALREAYPDDMTIVLQHQYWGLTVDEESFSVGLSFNKVPETLVIPFTAVSMFHDPSVQFMLPFQPVPTEAPGGRPAPQGDLVKFDAESDGDETVATAEGGEAAGPDPSRDDAAPEASPTGEVVSLDTFRKK